MAQKQTIDAMWDDSPIDVSTEVNFIWSIANRGYIADESAMLPAVCQNVVEDYDSKLMCNYSHERVNICVIGRLEKPFILPAAKAIEKITMTHLEDKFVRK